MDQMDYGAVLPPSLMVFFGYWMALFKICWSTWDGEGEKLIFGDEKWSQIGSFEKNALEKGGEKSFSLETEKLSGEKCNKWQTGEETTWGREGEKPMTTIILPLNSHLKAFHPHAQSWQTITISLHFMDLHFYLSRLIQESFSFGSSCQLWSTKQIPKYWIITIQGLIPLSGVEARSQNICFLWIFVSGPSV